MADINLTKLFVLVPASSAATVASIQETSKSTNKVYFLEGFNQIVAHGVAYGIDPTSTKELTSLIAAVGGETAEDGTVTVDLSKLNYNQADGTSLLDAISGIDAKLKTVVDFLESNSNIAAKEKAGIEVVASETDGYKTYTIGTVVDNKTVKLTDDGKLSAAKTLVYVPAKAEEGKDSEPNHPETAAHIDLLNADGSVASTILVSDIVGNGMLDHTSYNKETNELSLFFKQADGELKEEKIQMKDLIDINDVFIGGDSQTYLEVTSDADAGTATFDVKIKKMSDASYADEAVATGLADAADVKKYVDSKATDLAVSAQGDDYVTAAVDANDNKKINVTADVQDVTASAGTRGTWTVSDTGVATLADEIAPAIEGVEKSLVDGKQAIAAVKTYVDAVVAAEAAARDAKIEGAVKALDVAETEVGTGTNVHFKFDEVDGKVAIKDLAIEYATVATAKSENADTVITVTDDTKLVIGSDIKKVADFAETRIAEEIAKLDAEVESTETGEGAIKVKVVEEAGKLSSTTVEATYATHTTDKLTSGIMSASVFNEAIADLWETYADPVQA